MATSCPGPKGHHLGPVANVTIELPGLVQEYLDQPHDQLLQAPRYLKFLRAFVFQKSLWIVDGGYRSFYGPPQGLYVAGERRSDREFHNLPTPPSKKGDFEVVGCCGDELLVSWQSKDEERFFFGDPRDVWKEIHGPAAASLLLTPALADVDWTPDSTPPGRYEQPKILGPSLAASYLPALHGTPGSTPFALRSVHSEDTAVALLCSGHESRASLWMAPSGEPLAGLVAPEGCCFTGRVNSVLFATVDDGTELTAQEFELTESGSRAHPAYRVCMNGAVYPISLKVGFDKESPPGPCSRIDEIRSHLPLFLTTQGDSALWSFRSDTETHGYSQSVELEARLDRKQGVLFLKSHCRTDH